MEPIIKNGKEIGYMIKGKDILTGVPTVALHFYGLKISIPEIPETRDFYAKAWALEGPKEYSELFW
jgi:hypothetical protein